MGKKKQQSSGLGRTIIKDRFANKHGAGGDTFLHTSELNDGYDWGRLNLQSVTEQNNLEEFLATAELAGTEFTAEKLNVKIISKDSTDSGLPKGEELKRIKGLHQQHEKLLRIPRRPPWTTEMSASEVDQNEKVAFLEWRRSLASLQEMESIVMTPYEKNLDFWRQLWRVIERSDIIVQIVDARNPLLFYCPDLETYVKEVDPTKHCVVLVNKADLLTQFQREAWASYFTKQGVRAVFWSALDEAARLEESDMPAEETDERDAENCENSEESDDEQEMEEDCGKQEVAEDCGISESSSAQCEDGEDRSCDPKDCVAKGSSEPSLSGVEEAGRCGCGEGTEDGAGVSGVCVKCLRLSDRVQNTADVYHGQDLLDFLRNLHGGTAQRDGSSLTTVGMVGYPNVGKSSTINAILKMKKVPVSATPGRTKHFQTLYVDKELMLCDCPGLVFPSFVTTKAELVVSGVLPIDQMRDHIPPIALVCSRFPRQFLEATYGILIPRPVEGEDPERDPTPYEFLNAYASMRGYMTQRGVPDCPRASRLVLKDYVNGKLLYCQSPPGFDSAQFNIYKTGDQPTGSEEMGGHLTGSQIDPDVPQPSKVDREFFQKTQSTVHTRTARAGGADVGQRSGAETPQGSTSSLSEKPWKKHNNRKKKEKMRRVYGYLDK